MQNRTAKSALGKMKRRGPNAREHGSAGDYRPIDEQNCMVVLHASLWNTEN